MREPQFDRLRSEVADAVRQPEFSTVQARAGKVRRRRAATTSAVFLVTVLAAASFGYTVQNSPPDYGSLDPVPEVTCTQDCSWPWMTASASTGSELYGLVTRCETCDSELYVSPDDGDSWEARNMPPVPGDVVTPREVTLVAPGPGLLVWSERTFIRGAVQTQSTGGPTAGPTTPPVSSLQTWISSDGGRNWGRAASATEPADAIPAGARPVDCDLVELPDCKVGVLDPDTGRFAPLANQPGITVEAGWTDQVAAPLDGRVWVPGRDPATNKPAVAVSSDAGRTWHTHVFTGGLAFPADSSGLATVYMPKVAAGSGTTAYALTNRGDDTYDTYYTTDGGATWQAGGEPLEEVRTLPGYVTADGAHIVPTFGGASISRGTGRYGPVTLSGMPEAAIRTVRVSTGQADQPYLMPSSGSEAYLSKDGLTWQQVRLP
ncbi:sialidase family protein [Actinoplanes sp. NPDC026670]|uniref:sialidase family protein n=1 Tax=Actinoplanes sp. NPDC026670 TaxID=3154700 RepID=UPI0033F894A7